MSDPLDGDFVSDENRPYPEGVCWDEAWRQRQRAEKLHAAVVLLLQELPEGNLDPVNPGEYVTITVSHVEHEYYRRSLRLARKAIGAE
jgi:hypothetical protein